MPHGDLSDIAGFTLIIGGILQMYNPNAMLTAANGPFQGMFNAPPAPHILDEAAGVAAPVLEKELEMMTRWCGGMMMIVGSMLYTVRWNPINGKLSGFVLAVQGAFTAHLIYTKYDKETFVLRPFYVYALMMVLSGFKIFFFPNPMPGREPKKAA